MASYRASHFSSLLTAASVATLLAISLGCVVGQKIDLAYTPGSVVRTGQGQALAVGVADLRPSVKNGEKSPAYLGRFRGGFGNPWDVKTEGEIPLAKVLENGLLADLEALGFKPGQGGAPRTIQMEILDYDVDGMMNAQMTYELRTTVRDESGKTLFQETLKDNRAIKGSFWTGAKGACQEMVPQINAEIIRKITRENKAFLAAIQ